jgi:hypothetical protein
MRQHQAAAIEIIAMFSELFEAQVEVECRIVQGAFANEEVTARNLTR